MKRFRFKGFVPAFFTIFICSVPSFVRSADADGDDRSAAEETADSVPAAHESQIEPEPEDAAAKTRDEIEQLKAQMNSMREEYDKKLDEMVQECEQKFDDAALADLRNEKKDEESFRRFEFFGFYDLSFMWRHIKKGSFLSSDRVNTKPQFLLQHLHLYFLSRMTDSLRFLTEIQFTYLPNGTEISFDSGTEVWNTAVSDPYSQNELRLGGVVIHRAWFKWEPTQFFGIKAGCYLTPYGIWHVDHGSPVRLSILPPFENNTITPAAIRGKKPLPDSQLGIVVFGRLFPYKNLFFDYAFTVSNGRGPADTVIDYDSNKGLGLQLKLTYSRPNVEIAAGGYGYFGEYSERKNSPSETGDGTYGASSEIAENFKEYVLETDLSVVLYGVRVQAEYIVNLTKYEKGGRPLETAVGGNAFQPDFTGNYVYGLVGYQLPLDRLLKDMPITVYFGSEFDMPRDYMEDFKNFILWFGVNFKPSPYVTLKVEASRTHLEHEEFASAKADDVTEDQASSIDGSETISERSLKANVWTIAGQLAVSF
jgi:hypothetical protein